MARRTMKTASMALALVWAMSLAVAGLAVSQTGGTHPVEGTYEVTAIGNEIGTIKFVMALKRDGGKWAGEIKDAPLPMTINGVTVDADNNVTLAMAAGDAKVTATGKYDGGKLSGNFTAGDAKGTFSATKLADGAKPADKPSPSATSSSSAALEGAYDAQITAEGQGSLPFVLIIKRDGDKLTTAVENGGPINIVNIKVDGEAVTLSATYQGGEPFPLPGKLSGTDLSGKWEAGGFSGTWSAKKRAGK